LRIAGVKPKNNAPVGAHRDSPRALPATLKWVQLKSGYVHIGNDDGSVEPGQNVT
jgi:hypothetical protein